MSYFVFLFPASFECVGRAAAESVIKARSVACALLITVLGRTTLWCGLKLSCDIHTVRTFTIDGSLLYRSSCSLRNNIFHIFGRAKDSL